MHRSEEPAISDRYGVNPPYALLAQLEPEHAASTRRVGSSSLSQGTIKYASLTQWQSTWLISS